MKNNQTEFLIDLVVPVYHNIETLTRLFASVLTQTMSSVIKIFLVQDADEEDYTSLINKFKDLLNIELITLEQNSGPGTARRVGMQKGKAKYIMFMDADDTFQNPFAVQELFEKIEQSGVDAVNSFFLEEDDNHQFSSHNNNDWVWVFGKIYRRSYLEEYQIYFNDSRANEDTGFNTVIYDHGTTSMLPDNTYIWWFKKDSITRVDNSIYSFTGLEGWFYNMEWAINNLVRLNVVEEKIKNRVASVTCSAYCWYLEFLRSTDKRVSVDKYLEWVKKFMVNVYNKHTPTKEQLTTIYQNKSQDFSLTQQIPEITFIDFIKMFN